MLFFVSCLSCCLVCSLQPCGYPLLLALSFVVVFLRFCHLLIRCPHSDVKGDNSSLTTLILYQDYSLWVF